MFWNRGHSSATQVPEGQERPIDEEPRWSYFHDGATVGVEKDEEGPVLRFFSVVFVVTIFLMASAGLIVYALLRYHNEAVAPNGTRLACEGPSCYDLTAELSASINKLKSPCDDFYDFVCGFWPENHEPYQNQFAALQARVDTFVAEVIQNYRVKERQTVLDKVVLSDRLCKEVYENRLDDSKAVADFLKDIGISWPAVGNSTVDVLDALVTLALSWNLPVIVNVVLSLDLKTLSRRFLGIGYDIGLIEWMFHKEQHLSPPLVLRAMKMTAVILGGEKEFDYDSFAADLFRTDSTVMAKWAAEALSEDGSGYMKVDDIDTEGADSDKWLTAINKNLPEDLLMTRKDEFFVGKRTVFRFVKEFMEEHGHKGAMSFIGFHTVRQLAPVASYPMVKALFGNGVSEDTVKHAMKSACTFAASDLTSFAQGRLILGDILPSPWLHSIRQKAATFQGQIEDSFSWADAKTKVGAIERIRSVVTMIAWPEHLDSPNAIEQFYSYLPKFEKPFVRTYLDSYAAVMQKRKADMRPARNVSLRRDNEPLVHQLQVTATYNVERQMVLVPPAILFPPFLVTGNVPFSDGSLGHVISHELWHSFDPGILGITAQSPEGKWRSQASRRAYQDLVDCIVRAYEDHHKASESAKQALPENFADVLGLRTASDVFRSFQGSDSVLGFDKEQLFYIGTCFKWCSRDGDGASDGRYSPPRVRCNLPLMLHKQFAQAFHCEGNAAMARYIRLNKTCE